MKILLAADGSPHTQLAARQLVSHLAWFAQYPEVHIVHVQPPFPYARAASIAGKAAVESYQREESDAALAVAENELRKAQVPYVSIWRVGEIAAELAAYVNENGIDLVVMGSHGKGALANLALGSVATRCIAMLDVPVMIVSRAPAKKAAIKSARAPAKTR